MTYTPLDMTAWPVDDVLHCLCEHRYPARYTERFAYEVGFSWTEDGDVVKCPECNAVLRERSVVVPLHPDAAWALSLEDCKSATFYHYTTYEEWPAFKDFYGPKLTVHGNFYAHVGSLTAALDRASALGYPDRVFVPEGQVFEVRVASGARWSPDIAEDNASLHDVECGPEDYEVIRYLNKFESPGHISLAVSNDVIEVVGTVENWKEEFNGRFA